MPLIRAISAHADETVEVTWTLKDGRRLIERYTVPPDDVVNARLDKDGLRLDGPTLEDWVYAGYPAAHYPPEGYARRVAGAPSGFSFQKERP